MPDLDDRIRDLVARAAADAPPAPELDGATRTRPDTGSHRSRSRWLAGGIAGLSAAAALVALFWIGGDRVGDEAVAPATVPPTPVTPAPATTAPGGTSGLPVSVPPTVAGSVIDGAPTSSAQTDPMTTVEPTIAPSTTSPQPGGSEVRIVRAGPDGVAVVRIDGSGGEFAEPFTDEPMAVAFRTPDGRVLMQRSSDRRDPDADTALLVAAVPDEIAPLVAPDELAGMSLRLHDVAEVGGDLLALVESQAGPCATPDECDGSLWALDVDSGELGLILTDNMWESGFGRLHLAATGLIVGERFSEALSMPFSDVVPGSGAVVLDTASLGLEAEYFDCSTCPSAFAIDRSGATIGWLERDTDDAGVITQNVIVLASVDGTAIERFPLVDERPDGPDGLVPDPWLELVDVSAVPGTSAGWLIVNSRSVTGFEPATSPATVDLDTRTIVASPLPPGTVITAG